MKALTKIQDWGDRHHPRWLDFFRIMLGLVLIWKGVQFAGNLRAFDALIENAGFGMILSVSMLAHIIVVLHIIGGLLIVLGSSTRFCCLLNLPVLIVAVFYNINQHQDIFRPYAEIWLSTFVLVGLIVFLIEGDGVISIERDGAIETSTPVHEGN
ncbi:MAG: DoxX family protein [Arcticibacter sp.]